MKNKKYIPALRYNILTRYYDLIIKITIPENKIRKRLIELINPKVKEKILEFGFGTAQNLILLCKKEKSANFQGLEIDPKILTIALHKLNKNGLNVPLNLYDGYTFPFQDNSFDTVFSSLVFHQLDSANKSQCLFELHRVLKPNGKLVIGDWGEAKNIRMRLAFCLVQILDGFKNTEENVKGQLPYYMINCGFRNVEEVDFTNTAVGTFSYYTAKK